MNKLNIRILVVVSLLWSQAVYASDAENEPIDLVSASLEEIENYWVRVYSPVPVYPRRAAERGDTGYAEFTFVISKVGLPKDIKLHDWAPSKVFVQSAKRVLQQSRWRVAESNVDVKRVRSKLKITYTVEPRVSSSRRAHTPRFLAGVQVHESLGAHLSDRYNFKNFYSNGRVNTSNKKNATHPSQCVDGNSSRLLKKCP